MRISLVKRRRLPLSQFRAFVRVASSWSELDANFIRIFLNFSVFDCSFNFFPFHLKGQWCPLNFGHCSSLWNTFSLSKFSKFIFHSFQPIEKKLITFVCSSRHEIKALEDKQMTALRWWRRKENNWHSPLVLRLIHFATLSLSLVLVQTVKKKKRKCSRSGSHCKYVPEAPIYIYIYDGKFES